MATTLQVHDRIISPFDFWGDDTSVSGEVAAITSDVETSEGLQTIVTLAECGDNPRKLYIQQEAVKLDKDFYPCVSCGIHRAIHPEFACSECEQA